MKRFIALFLLILSFSLFSQDESSGSRSWNMSAGLRFSYDSIACKLGEKGVNSDFLLLYTLLEYNVDLSDYLTIGFIAGYKFSHMKQGVSFNDLPLTLSMDKTSSRYQGLLLGASLQSTPFSFGDFSIKVRGDFLYSLRGTQEFPIDLEIVSGTGTIKESFTLFSTDLLIQYEGFSAITPFIGGRFNLFSGKYGAKQTIETLSGETTVSFKQKKMFGPVGGVVFELGSNWEIMLKASLLSRFSASLGIDYIF